MLVYLIGSLANKEIRTITKALRAEGFEVFSDWHAAGEAGDREWKAYYQEMGFSYRDTLNSSFVEHAFEYDLRHLRKCAIGVLVMPAGRSGHLELGWLLGQGKHGYIFFPEGEPERPDLMGKLATGIVFSLDELIVELKNYKKPTHYLWAFLKSLINHE